MNNMDEILIYHNNEWYIFSNVYITNINKDINLDSGCVPIEEINLTFNKILNKQGDKNGRNKD